MNVRAFGVVPFRRLQWVFPIAVTVHNTEEALSMPDWVTRQREIPVHPGAGTIWIGLLVATVAAFVVTYGSWRNGKQSRWAYLLFGYVAAMLLNVVVPHVPAAIISRGYAPGLVTAVLINLPVMSVLLRQAVREQWVSGKLAIAYAALTPLVIGAAIAAYFVMA